MNDRHLSILLKSAEETAQLAGKLARLAKVGRTICLWGDVGAGKTFFARSLIQKLQAEHGDVEDVPSPTFTLIQTYDAGPLEIWHADLYRLSSTDEVYELGLASAFDTAFCLIEWPDRLGDLKPANALHLTFEHTEGIDGRTCCISCNDFVFLKKVGSLLEEPNG